MTATLPVILEAVRFRVNGRPVEVTAPGGRRLLDVLRIDLGLTGTKEGCGEGECGACSVLLDGKLVNACLVPLGQVDGREVRTVEGLARDGGLDPVQQAFLELGGTQCGLCAPGMLLAAEAYLARARDVNEPAVREAIAGNLCRCTGYTRIVAAIEAAAAAVPSAFWREPGTPVPMEADAFEHDVRRVRAEEAAGPRIERPTSLYDALARLAADPALRPVAGGTDVMVELAAGAADPRRPLLDLWELDELRRLDVERDELVLGALATWTELRISSIVHHAMPVLAEAAATVGADQVRNRGTIGGNCVTASPAGDLLPLLLATDARLEVAGLHGSRLVPAAAFWTSYRRTALAQGELLAAVRIPLVPGREVRFRKVGTRRAQAIAKVSVAVAWREDEAASDRAWRDVRVALGAVAPTVVRAARTEAALEGTVPGPVVAARAAALVREEIAPIDDVRSTADYRRAVAGRVLRRIILDAAG